ncbi:MAG: aminoacyl-tRNA hydrolase [Lachnospiraceae bacterium]|nr:aminoacyl-tRNA hydrolase [Lachnospiraceae bacterium]MCR5530580.1 aminoacyl-tRNA hydrolase [Lachnospiraceae bacterium]
MGLFRKKTEKTADAGSGPVTLIVGLGNPGRKYAGTRHNIGWDAVTALSDAFNIPLKTKEWKGISGRGTIAGQKVILVQPQTFMNASGECVRAYMDFYKIPAERVLIICDDISLEPGNLRLRVKGSAGGHNGLKSIIAQIGTSVFPRLRLGVGEKPFGWDLADHVLARFPKELEPVIRDVMARVVEEIPVYVTEGPEAAMSKFNGSVLHD